MRYSFTIILKAKRYPLSFLHRELDMGSMWGWPIGFRRLWREQIPLCRAKELCPSGLVDLCAFYTALGKVSIKERVASKWITAVRSDRILLNEEEESESKGIRRGNVSWPS
jgi:hypothetical protein